MDNLPLKENKPLKFDTIPDANYYAYVYKITWLSQRKVYIGGRYMPIQNRFSDIALEDLKQYQTSSSDKNFTKAMEINIIDFKFEILKTFKTSKYAYMYEAYLHNKYDAANNPRFINRRNEVIGSVYDGMSVWDCKLRKVIRINDVKHFEKKINTRFGNIIHNNQSLLMGRYCLLEDKEVCQHKHDDANRLVTLYWFNSYNDLVKDIQSITLKKININSTLNIDSSDLFNTVVNKSNVQKYYLDKEKCIQNHTHYSKQHTFYIWSDTENDGIAHTKTYYDWLQFEQQQKGFKISRLIGEYGRLSSGGVYTDYDTCCYVNKIHTIYTRDKYNTLLSLSLKQKEFGNIHESLWSYLNRSDIKSYMGYSFNPEYAVYREHISFTPELCIEDGKEKVKIYYDEHPNGVFVTRIQLKDILKQHGESQNGGGKTSILFKGGRKMVHGIYTCCDTFKKSLR